MGKHLRRKKTVGPPGKDSSQAERVAWLLEALWGGNRSDMARDIGVTHSVLVKVAAGTQNPGRRLLEAISGHPKVNPVWLVSGEGEALLEPRTGSTEGWPVPVSRQLLDGPLDQDRKLLTGDTYPVAGNHYRRTRYWLRIQSKEPVTKTPHTDIRPGDLILMETDPIYWQNPAVIHACISAVRIVGHKSPRLGWLAWSDGGDGEERGLSFEAFSGVPIGPNRFKRNRFGESLLIFTPMEKRKSARIK